MGEAREIYLKACGEVSDALQVDGFRWRRSRQDMVKKDADLTFRVWFQSSFRNALPSELPESKGNGPVTADLFLPLEMALAEIERFGSVSFMAHVSIHAQSIKRWRGTLAHPIRTDDGVAGTNIGNLVSPPHWLDVNLANPQMRSSRVEAIIALLRDTGFRYFDRFKDPKRIVSSLLSSSDPGMMDYMELEYAACYGSIESASQVLQRHLKQWPDCAGEYQEALHDYRQHGIPAALHGRPGPRLARMALVLGVEV